MKTKILNFIIDRFKQKEINVVVEKQQRTKDEWFRFFFKNKVNSETLIVTVLKDDEKVINDWYKKSHFDSSMNKKTKEEVMLEHPISEAVNEHFKQRFEIDGIGYYFRLS